MIKIFSWQTVIDHVRQGLSSKDAFYLICATHCLREDGSTLVQWLLFQKQVRRQCKEMKISYPNSLWVLLCIGQISPVERRELPGVKMPVTESQMQPSSFQDLKRKSKQSQRSCQCLRQRKCANLRNDY